MWILGTKIRFKKETCNYPRASRSLSGELAHLGQPENVVENIDQNERERVKCISQQSNPQGVSGSDACDDTHHYANNEYYQHFREEIPRQFAKIDQTEEHR